MAVDITTLPLVVASMLGISEFAGGVFVTLVLLVAIEMPLAVFRKSMGFVETLVGFLVLAFSVSLGWLDLWFLLFFSLLVAFIGGPAIMRMFTENK